MRQKKVLCLADYGIKSMRSMFRTEKLIYWSSANMIAIILFHKITHFSGEEITKMLVMDLNEKEDSMFYSCP